MKNKIYFKLLKTTLNNTILNIVFVLFLFTSINVFSQSNQAAQIQERSNYIHILNSNPANVLKIKTLLNLMDGVNSAIYLSDGQMSNYGQTPVCLYSDLASISLPVISNIQNSNIEMVVIKINQQSQLSSTINLAPFTNYKKLKYIYFRIGSNVNLLQLKEAIKNYVENYVLIYSIDKGA